MFYNVVKSIESGFDIISIMKPEKFDRSSQAIGFLTKLNKRVTSVENQITFEQSQKINEAINTVRIACKRKHPWIYEIQAFLNPFSRAYRIEGLSKNILFITKEKIEKKVVAETISNENPFEFFPLSKKISNNIVRLDDLIPGKTVGVVYYSSGVGTRSAEERVILDPRDFMEQRYANAFLIELNDDQKTARLVHPDDYDVISRRRFTYDKVTLNYIKCYAENVMNLIRDNSSE